MAGKGGRKHHYTVKKSLYFYNKSAGSRLASTFAVKLQPPVKMHHFCKLTGSSKLTTVGKNTAVPKNLQATVNLQY